MDFGAPGVLYIQIIYNSSAESNQIVLIKMKFDFLQSFRVYDEHIVIVITHQRVALSRFDPFNQ